MALRSPDWSNKWLTKFGTVQQRNLNGDNRFVQRPATTIEDGFEIRIRANSLADVAAFEAAYLAALATLVTYTDFEGSTWEGYWNPDSFIVRRGRPGCNYEVSVSFTGNKV